MPDLPNRPDREADLTAAIMLLFMDHLRALTGGDPVVSSIPPGLVDNLAGTFRQAARDLIAGKLGHEEPVGDAEAYAWAVHASNGLVRQVTRTDVGFVNGGTRAAVQRAIVNFQYRANMIGATETTAAITAGEAFATYYLLNYAGVSLRTTWYSEMDGRTCDVCLDLHGTGPETYELVSLGGPPLHPWCRCWLEHN